MKQCENHVKRFFCAAVLCVLCLCYMTLPVGAAGKQIVIKATEALGADTLALNVELPDSAQGDYEVYRAVAGGALQLIDTIPYNGNGWTSQNGGAWYSYGNRRQIVCFSEAAEMAGEVVFCDTGLQLGQTYSYRIVLKDDWTEETIYSNTVSGSTKLDAPEILKGYASSNTTVKIAWTKVNKAQGYVVYRQSGNTWKAVKTIKKASTVKYTNKKLKSGKTYKYRVRAYVTVNGRKIYGDYSQIYKVKLKKPTVKGSYKRGSVYGPSLNTKKLADVRRVVQSFKDNYIKAGMSNYEKAWIAFCYIRANCDYAWRGWQYNGANTAWGALVYGEAQCSGYARGMKALCDAIGVPCRYVHANTKAANPSHQWNMVKIDGKWYVLDAQGGFFLVGSQTWQKLMGMYWNTKGLPTCSKTDHPKGGFVSSEI